MHPNRESHALPATGGAFCFGGKRFRMGTVLRDPAPLTSMETELAHISRFLTAFLFLTAAAFDGMARFVSDLVHAVRDEVPPLLDGRDALSADRLVRVGRAEREASAAGAMFEARSRDHQLFIGDGFTVAGRLLPI
jgi:glutathione S-transferase